MTTILYVMAGGLVILLALVVGVVVDVIMGGISESEGGD